MKKIVFFDLDGTLLTREKKVLEENKEAIKKARENGIEIVICSGRQQGAVRHYQEEAGAGRYVITTNGAEIYDTETEEELFYCSLDKEFCKNFYNYMLENDLFFRIDTKYARYFNDEKNRVLDEILFEEEPNKFFDENNILQISIGSVDSKKTDEVVEYLKQFPDLRIENRYITRLTADALDMINIINKNASKGNAAIGLCKYLKIDPEEAACFGDDYNDSSMLKAVGYPVAMGNAYDEIKNLAKEITKNNNEPGISEVLNRFIEENKEQ